jgi:hypothetical protein
MSVFFEKLKEKRNGFLDEKDFVRVCPKDCFKYGEEG